MPPVERASLAGRPDLSPELIDALAAYDDEQVATALAMNHRTPPAVLLMLARRHPAKADWVANNANAPASLKDPLPLRDHTAHSIEIYLDERGASDEERAAMYAEHDRLPPPGGPPTREVWDRVHGGWRG